MDYLTYMLLMLFTVLILQNAVDASDCSGLTQEECEAASGCHWWDSGHVEYVCVSDGLSCSIL